MSYKLIRFSLGRKLKAFVSGVRDCFKDVRRNGRIVVVAREGATDKIQQVLERLRFFVPDLDQRQVEVKRFSISCVFSGMVLVVDKDLVPQWIFRLFNNVFNVDYERNSVDGWQLCAVAEYVSCLPSLGRRAEAKSRFLTGLAKVQSDKFNKCYVFGTGTSLELAIGRGFMDGYRIVCNTIVRDPELWHHLKPHFVVAGDAIYHFGFTEFAQAFRRDLRARLSESNGSVLFVYPELFDAIVRREFADHLDVLVPVPTGAHDNVDVDLTRCFELPALGNVLNLLLLPIGCTLSRTVALWGFDGRAPDDKLFWSNSQKHSYPELMESLTKAHPAFYETLVPKNKEDSYVKAVHGDELEMRLQRAEAKGFKFIMMHPSWTQTLQKRFQGEG